MQSEKINAYFEAGKLTTLASKNFVILSAVLIIFSIIDSTPKLEIPFLKLTLDYPLALSVLFLIHSFIFYKLIAAITYERLLKRNLSLEFKFSAKDTWRIAYPNYFNFVQHSKVFAKKRLARIIQTSVVFIVFPSVFIIPIIGVISTAQNMTVFSVFIFTFALSIYICGFLLASEDK